MKIRENRRLQNIKHELWRNKLAFASAIVLLMIILFSIFAFLSPYDPAAQDLTDVSSGPSASHWGGTDDLGRDYLTRAFYGGRVSLLVGFTAMLISVTIGLLVGTVSGYFGGWIDNILMRAVDVLSSIPWIILVTVASVLIGPGLKTIVMVIGFLTWMGTARLIRAETLSVKEREYVLYAKASGQSHVQVILKHIIPSILPTLIIAVTSTIASAIMMESTLSFLGLGIQEPNSSWGSMLNNAQGEALYVAFIPGLLIVMTVYSFSKLGEVFRVAFEPKTKGNS